MLISDFHNEENEKETLSEFVSCEDESSHQQESTQSSSEQLKDCPQVPTSPLKNDSEYSNTIPTIGEKDGRFVMAVGFEVGNMVDPIRSD